MDEAQKYIFEAQAFEEKVRHVSEALRIPPEWLMAVMFSESRLQSSVKNFKGSGATGLIQFMPFTARELGTTTSDLQKMTPVRQLDWVHKYIDKVRQQRCGKGTFKSLTHLYMSVLWPRGVNKPMTYVLYRKPSKSYKQNSGLDVNKDGKVTVWDIDQRMKKKFKTAYDIKA